MWREAKPIPTRPAATVLTAKFHRVELHPEETVVIYTDGSRLAKPNRGGTGIVLVWTNRDGHEETYEDAPPGYRGATPPQMELKAAIEGLKLLMRSPPIVPVDLYRKVWIYSDATYLVNNFQSAMSGWPAAKWRTRDGTPVENVELWKDLVKQAKRLGLPLRIEKVKGHGTNPYNQRADQLAQTSAKGAFHPPLKPSKLRHRKSPKRLRKGTIPMEGQRLTIYVHKGEFMRDQQLNQFEFSVETPGPLHGEVGLAHANLDIVIREGHSYLVRFNEDARDPRIVEVLMEVIEGESNESEPDDEAS